MNARQSQLTECRGPTTLVVYNLLTSSLRQTNLDHLNCFRQYGRGRYHYLNLAVRGIPEWLRKIDFDAVIYTTSFLGQRWTPALFEEQRERVRPLMGVGRARIVTPQDEFLRTAMVADFIEEFGVNHVVSVSPPSEWPKIYEGVDFGRVGFSQALTGYLSDATVRTIERIVAEMPARDLDIGYRARPGAPWLGRHGLLKGQVGEAVATAARERGMAVDISSDDADVLIGDDWFRFLARSKYTIGIEGGASVLDREGRFKEATEAYLRKHPDASFEEIEKACFPDEDGKLALFAVSPRHLEACATRTCQVLVEGDYNGILRPGEHYIEIRRDLSNLEQVLEQIASDSERAAITERAHRDVVASGRYSYRTYVREIENVIARLAQPYAPQGGPLRARAQHAAARAADRASWGRVSFASKPRPRLARFMRTVLPIRALYFVRKQLYGPAAAYRMTYG